jgi:hypothetical protein
MKQKIFNSISLALIFAMLFTSVALADNLVDNVTVGFVGTNGDTFNAGGSTDIGYKINANGGDGQNGCNASDGSPATVTLSIPSGVTATSSDLTWDATNKSLTFNTCGDFKNVTFSSSTAGNYAINVSSISDSGAGSYSNQANFTLHVLSVNTTTTTTAANASATYGDTSVTLSATVSPNPGGGTVSFTVGGNPAGNASLVGGVASVSFDPSALDTNSYAIQASFGGSGTFLASNDSATLTVNQAASAVIVTCPSGVTFTGAAQTPCSATATGAGSLNQPLSVSYSNNTAVGNATASATFGGDADHTGNTGSATFSIGSASSTVNVTCTAGPFTYSGSPYTPCSATATGVGGLNQSLTVAYSANVNAGTATASATFDGDANHTGSTGSATFAIGQAGSTVNITCVEGPFTYTGAAIEPCSATVTGAGGLNQPVAVIYANNTDAGTATASAVFAGDTNHTGNNTSTTFSIGQAASTVNVSCPAGPFTYTGSAQTPCSATATGAGGLNQTLTVTYADNTDAGTATASASYAGDDNHTGNTGSTTFTIGQASSTTTVTCAAGTFTYTGAAISPCSATVTGAGGLNETFAPTYANNVAAGTASASYSYAGDANHTGSSDSKTFTIDPAPSVTTVTCNAGPFTYNGSAITPCSAIVTGAGGLNQSLTVSYADNVDAGPATASASYAGDANHTSSNDSKSFTIDPAPSVTTVSCTAGPFTYSGSAIEPCSASVTGAGGLNQTLPVSYADNVDAGPASASASYAGDSNHTGSSDGKTFTIDPAPSVTALTCPANVTYTGAALSPCSASVTGAGGLNQSLTVNYTDNTNAGTAHASVSYVGDANHLGSSDSKTFSIDLAPSVTAVTCGAGPFVYTGSAFTPCSATVMGAGGLSQSLSVSYSNNTDAGSATASASYAGDDNHTASSGSASFTISKASSTTTVSCPANVTYSGSAQTPCAATVSGAGGLSESLTVSYTNNTNPGTNTATASASYAGDDNHQESNDSKTFSILYATTGMCYGGPSHTILQPINTDGTSVFKKGSTVPAKFRICDAYGNSIGTAGVVTSFRLIASTVNPSATLNEEVISTTPDNAFRWSATDQQWIFNLNTKNLSAGVKYTYEIKLNDGSSIVFSFTAK